MVGGRSGIKNDGKVIASGLRAFELGHFRGFVQEVESLGVRFMDEGVGDIGSFLGSICLRCWLNES